MVGLGAIVVLGVGMQWLARRLRVPAILLLIASGLAAGPWLGIIDPDAIFGDSLFTLVSMAVSLLLFEGGLGLDLTELRERGPRPVVQLVTLGVVVTWLAITAVAMLLFDLPTDLCFLLGGLLVVSGPTVVGPLLQIVRPREPTVTILRWEGIVIDPIGATLALVVLKVVTAGSSPITELVLTTLVGCGVGLVAAGLLVLALRTFSVPDDLEAAVTFMTVIAAYTVGERIFEEGGLFAATVLGVALANQGWVSVRRIVAFGHDVSVLVLGGLFVVLAARVTPADFQGIVGSSLALVVVMVLVIRPVVGWLCTTRAALSWRDRAFIGALAPRGIVAAATSALFALRLTNAGVEDGRIDAIVFTVIVGTCLVYGLGCAPLARALEITEPEPRGVLLVGDQPWLLGLADLLSEADEEVTVLATAQHHLAREPHPWRLLTVTAVDRAVSAALADVRTAVIASDSDEHNALVLTRCLERLPRHEVLLLPAEARRRRTPEPAGDQAVADREDVFDPMAPVDGLDEVGEIVADAKATSDGWQRRPFAPGTTQQAVTAAFATGGIRVVTGPVDAADGEILLGVWRADGSLDLAPRSSRLGPDQVGVVAGGAPPDR